MTAPIADKRRGRPVGRFHVWCLPLLWSMGVGGLWCLLWGQGDAGMAALLAGIAGLWANFLLRAEGVIFVIVQLTGGAVVMGLVGLAQDLLGVRKWVYPVYFVTAIVYLGYSTVAHGIWDVRLGLVVQFLFYFCFGLYVVSVVSCMIAGAARLVRFMRGPNPPPIRIRFSTRTILLVTAAVALLLGLLVPLWMRARQRYQTALPGAQREQPVFHAVESLGGRVHFTPVPEFDSRSGYPYCRAFKVVLDGSSVTDADLDRLGELVYLKHLSLRNTQVTDAGLAALKGFHQLEVIDLTGSKVTGAGVADLRRSLPRARIIAGGTP